MWYLSVILLIIIFILVCKTNNIENFYWGQHYCPSCNSLMNCSRCYNCGICIDPNGNKMCARGNYNGPLFKDCSSWQYKNKWVWGGPSKRRRPNWRPPRRRAPHWRPYSGNPQNPYNRYFSM